MSRVCQFQGQDHRGREESIQTFNTKYRAVGDHDFKSDWIFISVKRGETRTVNVSRFIQQADATRGIKATGATFLRRIASRVSRPITLAESSPP